VIGGVGSPCLADGGCGSSISGIKCITQPLPVGSARFCTIGCQANTGFQCEVPLYCQASTAFNGFSGACFRSADTVTAVGKPCTNSNQCSSSVGVCRGQGLLPSGYPSWVQGYCSQSCAAGQPTCPAGAACTDVGETNPICLKSCRVGLSDCRPDYTCARTLNGGVCIPACHQDQDCGDALNYQCRLCDGQCVARQNSSGQVGDVCTGDNQCGAGQLCSQLDPTKATRMCTLDCGKGCGDCPTGSECHPLAPTQALFCARSCSGPGTCPAGTRCANLPTGQACMPPCGKDLDCPVGQACLGGECLNPDDDAGCGAFCRPDGGTPIVISPKDGGTGPGGSGGCGCSSAADFAALLAAAAVVAGFSRRRTRERAWR
jgi:hypothetical protein